ncbi:cytidine deaminase [Oscillospiraceae bacterium OttesenSCG-928-F05]|nr:cytidine deaminase [Oscillospiraceae bacterium OttesenSCG-928-F05]
MRRGEGLITLLPPNGALARRTNKKECAMLTDEALVARALAAREKAYAPYSKFRVGAALECEDGTVFDGVNVENAAYGVCLCAERAALAAAVTAGKRNFRRIAVVGGGEAYCTPCGICRQALAEFSDDLICLSANEKGDFRKDTIGGLLPESFSLKK